MGSEVFHQSQKVYEMPAHLEMTLNWACDGWLEKSLMVETVLLERVERDQKQFSYFRWSSFCWAFTNGFCLKTQIQWKRLSGIFCYLTWTWGKMWHIAFRQLENQYLESSRCFWRINTGNSLWSLPKLGMWEGVYMGEVDRWVGWFIFGSFEEFNLVLGNRCRIAKRREGRIVGFRSFGETPKTLMSAALSPGDHWSLLALVMRWS